MFRSTCGGVLRFATVGTLAVASTAVLVTGCAQGGDTARRDAAAAPRSTLVLHHVTLIDGTGAQPVADATVVIAGGRIVAAGPTDEVTVPEGAEIVGAAGKSVIPGLWDMHAHLSKVRGSALSLFVVSGVTGVRDMGGDHQELRGWRAEIEAGDRTGPRIVMAGPYLESAENAARQRGTPVDEMVEPVERTRLPVGTPADADRVVDSLAAAGIDFVKIRTVASPETYRAIAIAATRNGLDLVGHVFGMDLEDVIAAGQHGIEHCMFPPLDDVPEADRRALFRRLAENGVSIVPTLANFPNSALLPDSVVHAVLDDSLGWIEPRRAYLSRYLILDWREQAAERDPSMRGLFESVYASTIRDVREMREEGVLVMPGSDAAILMIFPGSALHDELALFVSELGMTPMEAIESATRGPAEFLGVSDSLGTIEPGKLADLVLLVKAAEDLQINDWPRNPIGEGM